MPSVSLRRSMKGSPINPLTQTSLYKYFSFLDFASIEETGRRALGLLYRKMGKVPMSIGTNGKRDKVKNDYFILVRQAGGRYVVKAVGEPDLECFSPFEVSVMRDSSRFMRTNLRWRLVQGRRP